MYHILLPYDESAAAGKALDYVIDLNSRLGELKITLLHVCDMPFIYGGAASLAMIDSLTHDVLAVGQHLLKAPAERLAAAGIVVDSLVYVAEPGRAIAEQARSSGCDAIVMGTRGLGRLGDMILGSVAYKTVHQAAVPVTLVR